ncbi:MAG: response regulator [Gammaproteobacteria bacterium]|nr:MAG: response regulator [Gammaproteobacteria bacterium]RKZ44326.1 MAG: response regulator [Gammaproteobacteria bacterium]RKZ76336.1 MAG: response regulator [Gammaproteobacteria bacterium]
MSQAVILCVDDERIILDSLQIQLEDAFGDAYLYEFAENAEDALELIEELNEEGLNILVIVSDWLMPGIKGDELLIRVHQLFPDIVKILLTGQADETAIKRVHKQVELQRCIYKPWDEEELVKTIKQGLKES